MTDPAAPEPHVDLAAANATVRFARGGLLVVLLLVAGWYVWRQVSLKPECDLATFLARTTAERRNIAPPPDEDVSDELTAAFNRIPRTPALTAVPPPPGRRWADSANRSILEQVDLLADSWDPSQRPWQAALSEYHAAAAPSATADDLAAMLGRTFRLDSPWNPRGALGQVPVRSFGWGIHFLAARARWQQAANNDDSAAWRELRTALWLTGSTSTPDALSFVCSYRVQVLSELIQWLNERRLPADLLADIDRTLAAESPVADVWARFLGQIHDYLSPLIASSFSLDADGNGRLVFNHGLPVALVRGTLNLSNLGLPVEPRSALWNVFSPLYYDRAAVSRHVRERLDALATLPEFRADQPRFIGLLPGGYDRAGGSLFSPLAGPVLERYGVVVDDAVGMTWRTLQQAETSRRAARLMVALCAYRLDHGDWPAALTELPARYRSSEFHDPYSGAPFGYRRAADGMVLYSVGPDGADNGGTPGRFNVLDRYSTAGDAVFTTPREKSWIERLLVPVAADLRDAERSAE